MRIAVLQHSPNTPPGSVNEWIRLRGHQGDLRRLFKGDPLPDLAMSDAVIVLGGGMNVDQTKRYPWLVNEKVFLEKAVANNRHCLGLCLGAQLLAQVLGSEVRKAAHWEVGWHAIDFADGSQRVGFHWHQDIFDLPKNATRLAWNAQTQNQGFEFGTNVRAWQFHPEATENWVRSCAADDLFYPQGPFVQKPEELISGIKTHIAPMRNWFFDELDRAFAIRPK